MNILKRLGAVALALVLVISVITLSTPHKAIAADNPEAWDDEIGAKSTTVVVHKYMLASEIPAGDHGTGTEEDADGVDPAAVPLGGIQFTVQLLLSSNGTMGRVIETVTTDENGLATFTPLLNGADGEWFIYVIKELPDESGRVTTPMEDVYLHMPVRAGGDLLETVNIYPKNRGIAVEKTPLTTSVTIGDEIPYTIRIDIPADYDTSEVFKVSDLLPKALSYKDGSVEIFQLNAGNEVIGTLDDTDRVDYTTGNGEDDDQDLVVVDLLGYDTLDAEAARFEVRLIAIVNEIILDDTANIVNNIAVVDYTDSQGHDHQPKSPDIPDVSEIHVGTIRIAKVDENKAPLDGASFKLATSMTNAEADQYLRILVDEDDHIKVVDFGEDGWDAGDDWVITSGGASDSDGTGGDSSGITSFAGVKDFIMVDETKVYLTYYIVEVDAPSSYNKLLAPHPVTFSAAADKEHSYTIDTEVTNLQGSLLPETGGSGTVLFTVVGAVLVIGAVLVLVARKKNDDEAEEN